MIHIGISWLWEEYKVEKKEKGKQYHLPYNIKAVGLNIKWGKGGWGGNFGEENQDLKERGWGRIPSCRELYTPLVAAAATGHYTSITMTFRFREIFF